jgi:hypothetical protein
MTAEEIKQGLLDTFLRVADRFGVPCVILAIVMYFGREAAIAMHKTVMQPIVQGHLEFLDTTAETLKEIGQVQRQQATALQELSGGQKELHATVKALAGRGEK